MPHTAKHTPGPWSVRTANNLTCICTPKGEMQVSLRDAGAGLWPLEVPLQEWLANAHIMAAAPAMYSELEHVPLPKHNEDASGFYARFYTWHAGSRKAALAQAAGE